MSFMNRSGYPLVAIAQFYKFAPSEILVVLDDLALPLGRIRIRAGGGTGGHNGLDSVIMQFGTEEISTVADRHRRARRLPAQSTMCSVASFEEERAAGGNRQSSGRSRRSHARLTTASLPR